MGLNGQKYGCTNPKKAEQHIVLQWRLRMLNVKDCVWTDKRFSEGVICDEREEARGMFALCSLNFM